MHWGRSILSSDNSNSAADIDESSIRAGIINQAATYVRRSLPGSDEETGYWPSAVISRNSFELPPLRSADQSAYFKIRACNIYDASVINKKRLKSSVKQ